MIDWNFGDQKPLDSKSQFTKNADQAFEEFCQKFLNNNSVFKNSEPKPNKSQEGKKENVSSQAPLYTKVGSKTLRINSNGKVLSSVNFNTISAGSNIQKNHLIDDFMNKLDTNYKNENFNHLDPNRNSANFEFPRRKSIVETKPEQKPEIPKRPSDSPPPRPPPTYLKNTQKYYFYENSNDIFINTSKSDLDDDSCLFEIPKKNKFQDEFYSRSRHSINQLIQSSVFKEKENGSKSFSNFNVSPYVVNSSPEQSPKPKLGFRIITCGMNKKGRLPIPKANFFLDKGDFGDDAGFYSENMVGDAFGVADGATGNCIFGYDPGDFSRNLMKLCSEIFIDEDRMYDAKSLILKAYDQVQEKTCYGSCTACVITLNHTTNVMTAANVGDTGYCVIRNGKIIHHSVPQRLTFECPRQLDSYPWKEASRQMGISYTDILGQDTELEKFEVKKDDVIILSSDGLFDNLEHYEIEEICHKSKSLMDAAENLVYRSVKYYRKPDDILVIIAKVVENKPMSYQHKYSKEFNPI